MIPITTQIVKRRKEKHKPGTGQEKDNNLLTPILLHSNPKLI